MNTVREVEARLAELRLAGFDEIVLDLSGVTFFDSSGVHLVMRWIRRAAEERFDFAVLSGNDAVDKVLQVAGVKPHLVRDEQDGHRPPSKRHAPGADT